MVALAVFLLVLAVCAAALWGMDNWEVMLADLESEADECRARQDRASTDEPGQRSDEDREEKQPAGAKAGLHTDL